MVTVMNPPDSKGGRFSAQAEDCQLLKHVICKQASCEALIKGKGKAVPLHAMEALGGRGV
jgi:hypothetical protein